VINLSEYKSVNKYFEKQKNNKNNDNNSKKFVINFIYKCLLSGLLLISTLCIIKMYPDTKDVIEKRIYKDNFSFAKINNFYEKYFGSILPVDSLLVESTQPVFDEKLVYNNEEAYNNGVKLTVNNNYLMPVLESGIVVFIGNKDNYGQTIIIQQVDGIDLWYVNVNTDSVKLYDYVEKGSLLGECLSNEIFLYYQKKGEFLNYKEYLS